MDLTYSYDYKRPDGDTESEEWGDNSKIQLSGGLIHLEAGGYPYPPANFININGGENYADGIIIQTYNDNTEGGDGPIHLNGQVFVNGTSLTDLIGAGSSVDLSNYQTKLNYYSESNYDDGSSHVFITADQTKIGNSDTYIDVVPYISSKSITIQNNVGDITVNASSDISLTANKVTMFNGNLEINHLNGADATYITPTIGSIRLGKDNNYISVDPNGIDSIKLSTSGRRILMESYQSSIIIGAELGLSLYGTNDGRIIINEAGGIDISGNSISIGTGATTLNLTNKIDMGTYFTAPVYTENTDGTYTKTSKTVSLRVVERDGAYTIVID